MVSGLRGSRFPPALVVSALPPAGGGTLSCVVPYRGGGVGRGAQPHPHSLVSAVWAIICAAACVGAGAVAAAGCAGGSASG